MQYLERSRPEEAIARLRTAERLRYQEIEQALTDLLRVLPTRAIAFRARLRHLREVGVPAHLPNVGRGRVNDYSSMDALEILLALRLEQLHTPPVVVARLANRLMIEYWRGAAAEMRGELDDLLAFIFPSDSRPEDFKGEIPSGKFDPKTDPSVFLLRGVANMPRAEPFLPREFVRISVSVWARDIIATLERIIPDIKFS